MWLCAALAWSCSSAAASHGAQDATGSDASDAGSGAHGTSDRDAGARQDRKDASSHATFADASPDRAPGQNDGSTSSCADPPEIHGDFHAAWAGNIGSDAFPVALAGDGSGDAFVTGNLSTPTRVGSMELAPKSGEDLNQYVAKIDRSGHTVYGAVFPGVSSNAIGVDASGSAYFLAQAIRSPDLGAGSVLVKLDGAGTKQWSRVLVSSTSNAFELSLAVTLDGTVAVVGASADAPPATTVQAFDPSGKSLYSIAISGFQNNDERIAYDASGVLHLAGTMLTPDGTMPSGIYDAAIGPTGKVMRAGPLSATGGSFGAIAGGPTNTHFIAGGAWATVNLGFGDWVDDGLFYAQVDASGTATRGQAFTYPGPAASSAFYDASGRLVLAGTTTGVTDLGGGLLLPAKAFVSIIGSDGSHVFSGAFGGPRETNGTAAVADAAGFWLLAETYGPMDFGGIVVDGGSDTSVLARFEPGSAPVSGSNCAFGDPPPTGARAITLTTGGTALTADANSVYWTDSTAIWSAPVGGGSPKVLTYGRRNVVGMVSDGTWLYWAESGNPLSSPTVGDGAIAKMPVGGGAVTTLASNQVNPTSMAVSAGTIFWTNEGVYSSSGTGDVRAVSVSGGTSRVLLNGLSDPSAISVHGDRIVFSVVRNANGACDVLESDTSGSAPIVLASAAATVLASALDDVRAYWVVASTSGIDTSNSDGSIEMLTLADAGAPTVIAGMLASPSGLTLSPDGKTLYFALLGNWFNGAARDNGGVSAYDVATGKVTVLASGRAPVVSLAANAPDVFWSEFDRDTPVDGVYAAMR